MQTTTQPTPAPPQSAEKPAMLDAAQAAKIIGIPRRRVWKMIREGELPHVVLGKRTVRVPSAALDAYLASASEAALAAVPSPARPGATSALRQYALSAREGS